MRLEVSNAWSSERGLPDFWKGSFCAKGNRENGTGRCYGKAEGNEEQHVNYVHSHFTLFLFLFTCYSSWLNILLSRVSPIGAKLWFWYKNIALFSWIESADTAYNLTYSRGGVIFPMTSIRASCKFSSARRFSFPFFYLLCIWSSPSYNCYRFVSPDQPANPTQLPIEHRRPRGTSGTFGDHLSPFKSTLLDWI